MSASSNGRKSFLRKGNIGRALVRFLIGAIILAAIVIMINEFWLKEPAKTDDTTTEQTASNPVVDTKPLPTGEDENNDKADDGTTDQPTDPTTEDQPDGTEPEGKDVEGTFGDEPDVPDEPTPTPEPTATPEPTPTPEPAATAVPADLYSKTVTSRTILSYKWHLDKANRVNHGITDLKVLPSVNGGNVIYIAGWSFGTYTSGSHGWNGKKNTTYVDVTNEAGKAQLYETKTEPGITGMTHTTTGGSNMDQADFTCYIDVSKYPNGTYKLGSRNVFYVKDSRYSHGYGFGDAYTFTVVDGFVTAVGGVENN